MDYEYQRSRTRNLFLFFEPMADWRQVEVTEHRAAQDFAHQMRWLVDVKYPDAESVEVILDNLNTHELASLHETSTRLKPTGLLGACAFTSRPSMGKLAQHGGNRVQRPHA